MPQEAVPQQAPVLLAPNPTPAPVTVPTSQSADGVFVPLAEPNPDIQQPSCSNKSDLDYYIFRVQMALSQAEINDWLPNHITHAIRDIVPSCPDALKADVELVASKTQDYDNELDQASTLAIRTIQNEIRSLKTIKTLHTIIQNANITNANVLHHACLAALRAIDISIKGRDAILQCAEQLKRDVTPNHDIIVQSVKRITEVVVSEEAHKFTEDQIKVAKTELNNLSDSIYKAIHADQDRVEKAGEAFRKCISTDAFGLDLGLARVAGHLDVIIGNIASPNDA